MLKTVINFEDIKSVVTAAEHLQLAGQHDESKRILLNLAEDIEKNLK